jgi:hypothetical protein
VKLLMLLTAIVLAFAAAKNALIDRDVVDTALLSASSGGFLVSSILWKKGVQ